MTSESRRPVRNLAGKANDRTSSALAGLAGSALERMSDEQIQKAIVGLGMEYRKRDAGEAVTVNVENYRRVETNRMFFGMVLNAGGANHLHHETEPISCDQSGSKGRERGRGCRNPSDEATAVAATANSPASAEMELSGSFFLWRKRRGHLALANRR
jgi:hypothetical protein